MCMLNRGIPLFRGVSWRVYNYVLWLETSLGVMWQLDSTISKRRSRSFVQTQKPFIASILLNCVVRKLGLTGLWKEVEDVGSASWLCQITKCWAIVVATTTNNLQLVTTPKRAASWSISFLMAHSKVCSWIKVNLFIAESYTRNRWLLPWQQNKKKTHNQEGRQLVAKPTVFILKVYSTCNT